MSAGWRATIGAAAWCVFVLLRVPNLHHGAWAESLLLLAALTIVPLLLETTRADLAGAAPLVARAEKLIRGLQLPAALLLVAAYWNPPGMLAALCAAPWTVVLVLIAGVGVCELRSGGIRDGRRVCRDAGYAFAAIAAAWLMADRVAYRPLGFDEAIVLLTAVHFHYAGLILLTIGSHVLSAFGGSRLTGAVAWTAIAGVPLVALGITLSQLEKGRDVETLAALTMAAGAAGIGCAQIALGLRPQGPVWVRCLWVMAGCSLLAGMALAALYGMRGVFSPWPWLDLPWMRALHGSANALGFALCGTIAGWGAAANPAQRAPGWPGA